ncbi:hypothetical protein [Phenylobacterium sp.]|uniref:hypothetical protein n=1 Tax=Phenylobacterium sp. TaxID=1871053 RepID=UPI0025D19484|nr:hypothetical protein [Phenylobacterium sp.]
MVALVRRFRRAALIALSLATVGVAAAAHDYIVVRSTDPAIAPGRGLDGGQRLAVAVGRTITLMHASGDVVQVKGAAGGVVVPTRKAAGADAQRLEELRVIVSTDSRQVTEGLGQHRTRGGVCPTPASLTTLDAIAQVQSAGCTDEAAKALDAWIASHPAPES